MSRIKEIVLIVLAITSASLAKSHEEIVQEFIQSLGTQFPQDEPKFFLPFLYSGYDFVIVGAGTAGCVLANRLSENPDWTVLLIEAGIDENRLMDIPVLAPNLALTPTDWQYKIESSNTYCLGMRNNECNWPRGKVMGGSSVLNYMVYTRGSHHDYDNWARLGNPGWSYADVLPYFIKMENSRIPDGDPGYRGNNGPVTASYNNGRTDLATVFLEAGVQSGAKRVDYNGKSMIGFSYLQATTKDGYRFSANTAYIRDIQNRPNLHIKRLSQVTNIIIDPSTKIATGVRFKNGLFYTTINAKREVILSAGSINSPQILMLSGIGPEQHLRDMGIEPIVNLSVGNNLQDHVGLAGLAFTTNATTISVEQLARFPNIFEYLTNSSGLYSIPAACESIGFYDLSNPNDPDGHPDLELILFSGTVPFVQRKIYNLRNDVYDHIFRSIEQNNTNSFLVFPIVLRPKSRGRISLKSSDPFEHPKIEPNYFADPYDMDIIIKGIRKTIALLDQPAFKAVDAKVYDAVLPQCSIHGFQTDTYWDCYTRHFTSTIFHPVGTCKMGPDSDPAAVVDSRLRVKGVQHLRVIDASIMPELVAGHTNAPTFMIAERAADFIKQDWNYS